MSDKTMPKQLPKIKRLKIELSFGTDDGFSARTQFPWKGNAKEQLVAAAKELMRLAEQYEDAGDEVLAVGADTIQKIKEFKIDWQKKSLH